jgi:three-Cys-motif partner protein
VSVPSVRKWHAWSVWKTKVVLGAYLPAFARASKKAPHCTFIDCFAGSADAETWTGTAHEGSPWIALRARPPLTHALFFEIGQKAGALEEALRKDFPERAFHVVAGDCNVRIGDGLRWIREQGTPHTGPQLGPVFVLLDPDSMQLAWSTVTTLSRWTGKMNPDDFDRQGRLVELLVLFPTGPLRRSLPSTATTEEAPEEWKAEVDRLFGNNDWRVIYEAQRSGAIQGEDAWMHYVALYRLGLHGLGYKYTSVIEVRNTKNVVQYHLVFATVNKAGEDIMKRVLSDARKVLPAMVASEKLARKEHGSSLFEESDDELDRYAADPKRWALFTDAPPVPFSPMEVVIPIRDEPPTLFDQI